MDSGVILCAGIRGSGKTHRIREIIERNVARGRRVCCFDPSGDLYNGLVSKYTARKEGERAWIRRFDSVQDMIAVHKRGGEAVPRISCVVIPKGGAAKMSAEGAVFRTYMLIRLHDGLVWVCDEGETLFSEWGRSNDAMPVVVLARNTGSLIIVACKDPVRVSVDIRRGCDCLLVFALSTREAANSLRDSVNPESVAGATGLRKREFLYVAPTTETAVRGEVTRLGAEDDLPEEL